MRSRPRPFLSILGAAALLAGCSEAPTAMDPIFSVAGASSVEIWAPQEGGQLRGAQTFRAAVAGLSLSDYTIHWQVDAGPLNAMSNSTAGGPHKTATVDVTSWTWNAEGSYSITFVARHRRGSKLIAQQSVRVNVPQVTNPNPFTGRRLWVNPNSNARRQADAWRSARPADAEQMDKIARQPEGWWFGDWSGDIRSAVAAQTSTITGAGALPVYVAYNVPVRDCNSYSAGGATSASAYRSWIRAFAAGLGSHRAAIILEPDALAAIGCLGVAQRDERYALLADAVSVLKAQGSAVYIDAGHSAWIAASEMALRLQRANIAAADGFALNVSNFQATGNLVSYGTSLSDRVGGKRFVIDTSRNGLGPTPDNQWCNPVGRALGQSPTGATGNARVDAYLWIKKPGESDGTCNGGPAAGRWWADYALGLAQRAPHVPAYTF
jgi:endoglucanase